MYAVASKTDMEIENGERVVFPLEFIFQHSPIISGIYIPGNTRVHNLHMAAFIITEVS